MSKITIDRETVEQALVALEIGRDYTFETAEQFHIEMRGYKQQRHDAMDSDVAQIDASIATLRQALQQPNEFHPDWDQIKPFHDRIAELEKVAKQALEALEYILPDTPDQRMKKDAAIIAIRKALGDSVEQPRPAPPELEAAVNDALGLNAQHEPVNHAVIAGALFDFLGWLTSRQQRVTWSSCDDATTAIDAVIEFAKMRGLSLDEVHVLDWQDRIQAEEVLPWPVIDKSAAIRIATALGWEPKREWVGLTDEEKAELDAEYGDDTLEHLDAIETKLKEKNNG